MVLAVLAIIASLLLPALSRAKSSAHSAVCKSNLRQLGVTVNLYVTDYAGYPPDNTTSRDLRDVYKLWSVNLNEFIQQQLQYSKVEDTSWHAGMWSCPGDKRTGYRTTGGSYGYNAWGGSPSGLYGLGGAKESIPSAIVRPTQESEVRVPSEMLAIGDGFLAYSTNYATTGDKIFRDSSGRGSSSLPNQIKLARERHRGAINAVYCDAHVEAIKLEKLFFEETDAALRRWNRDHEPHWELLKKPAF